MDMRDLRLAFRTLVRTPFVTSIAVLSLALGIGANTASYSTFHGGKPRICSSCSERTAAKAATNEG